MLETVIEQVHGRSLRVARLGTGPVVLLLHGYPDNLQIWCELAPLLAGSFQVVAFDWPGMGKSDAWPGGTTPDALAHRLVDLLDAWGLERVSLIGMDVGGQPALLFASRFPHRIERLVVMNSLVMGDAATSWDIRLLRHYKASSLLLRRLPRLVFWRALSTFLPPGRRMPSPLRRDLWNAFRRPEVRRWITRLCAGYQGSLHRLPALYARILCPTLILWGGADRHFPPAQAMALQQHIPHASLEILPEGEHWMAWYRAPEVATAVLRLLQSSTAST